MLLIPFLEATADYLRLKAVRDGERQVVKLEKSMKKDVARLFRLQGTTFLSHLPDKFDDTSVTHAWALTELETYAEFRDILKKHGRRAAYTGIRTLERELAVGTLKEEAKSSWDGAFHNTANPAKKKTDTFGISFDEFDIDAFTHIEQNAGTKISQINETTRKEIRGIIADGFKGELQDDGTTKYKSYQQIAKDIKDRFSDFAVAAPQGHIRNRAELVAVNEIRDGYETSKAGVRDKLEARGWNIEKRWSTMGDEKVSALCRSNESAGWIDNKSSFPSGHMQSPGHVACRCNCQSRVGSRKEQSELPKDRWLVTRKGNTVTIKQNPKYANGYDIPNNPPLVTPGDITKSAVSRRKIVSDEIIELGKMGESKYPTLKDGSPVTNYRGRDPKEIGKWTLLHDKSVPDEAIEVFNEVLKDVQKDFDKLGVPSLRGQKTLTSPRYGADMGDGIIGINKKHQANTVFNEWGKGTKLISSDWKQGDIINNRPFTGKDYFETPEERFMFTIYHESGHHIHQQYDVNGDLSKYNSHPFEKELDFQKLSLNIQQSSPTKYGATKVHEYFAENYALLKMGRQDLLSPEALRLFKKIIPIL